VPQATRRAQVCTAYTLAYTHVQGGALHGDHHCRVLYSHGFVHTACAWSAAAQGAHLELELEGKLGDAVRQLGA
jgi:hypothetical protein